MQLVACPVCHTQYDVSQLDAPQLTCRCGETLENRPHAPVDAAIARCGSCGAQLQAEADACSFCGSEIERDPAKLSLICPECFARNADASRFCVACGVAFRPEALAAGGEERPCPACETRMPPSQVAGVPLNECPACRGLWVPGQHFDTLVQRAARAREERSGAAEPPRMARGNPAARPLAYRRCPDCDQLMRRTNYGRCSGVILDVCNAHGTWLDADELEQVAGFILARGPDARRAELEAETLRLQAAAAVARARTDYTARGPGRVWTPPARQRYAAGRGLLGLLRDILD